METPELPEVNSGSSDDVSIAPKFSKSEFERKIEKEPIEKLADEIAAKPELSDQENETEVPVNTESKKAKKQTPSTKEVFKEPFNLDKWDGNITSLPEKLQKIVKDHQAMATTKAQEAAELRKQVEEFKKKPEASSEAPLFTPEEYEEAQLNPNKFTDLVMRVANRVVEEKSKELMPIVSQIQQEQQIANNSKLIDDFAKKHEDFWELYEDGLVEPFLERTKSLEQAYTMATELRSRIEARAMNKVHNTVSNKKNASTFTKSGNHSENVMYIEGSKDDALRKQIELAMSGKNIQVRVKK